MRPSHGGTYQGPTKAQKSSRQSINSDLKELESPFIQTFSPIVFQECKNFTQQPKVRIPSRDHFTFNSIKSSI